MLKDITGIRLEGANFLSFLKCQLQPYLCGHDDTKVLIMTHDLQTYYNLQKLSEELISACNRKGKKNKYSQLELLRNSVTKT